MRINFRFLFLTLVVVLIAGGGVFGAVWWRSQPKYLYDSANSYFEKGDTLQKAGKPNDAKEYYQWADAQLEKLLDKTKDPNNTPGQLLRHRVLFRWSQILKSDEDAQGIKRGEDGKMLPSEEKATRAMGLAYEAARDKDQNDAQEIALNYRFKEDNLSGALTYANNIVNNYKNNREKVTDLSYVHGAYFVMASQAMSGPLPNPDLGLQYIQEDANVLKTSEQGALPKWRMVGLEMRAMKAKIDQMKAVPRGGRPGPRVDPKVEEVVREFQTKIEENLDRVRRELDEVTPESKDESSKPKLGQLSATDIRGLLDFLGLSLREAIDRDQVLRRAELITLLAKQMTEPGVEKHVARETTKFLASVPLVLASLDDKVRPQSKELDPIYKEIEVVTKKMVDDQVNIEPATYRQMAETEYKEGRYEQTLQYAKQGLDIAKKMNVPAKDPEFLGLNYIAAWVSLLLKKTPEADEYLQPLRSNSDTAAKAHLIEGVAAVLDNRLEVALRHLQESQKSPKLKDNLYSSLGMGYAQYGLGKYDEALTAFNRVEKYFKEPGKITQQDKEILTMLKSNADALNYDIFRCYVALSQLDKAAEYRDKLKSSVYARTAEPMMIGAQLVVANKLRAAGKEEEAVQASAKARSMMDEAKKLYGELPSLTNFNISMILSEPAAPGAPGLVFGAAINVDGMMRMAKAENYLKGLVEEKKDFTTKFMLNRWLQATGRLEEAEKMLGELEKTKLDGEQLRTLMLDRAKLALARQQPQEYSEHLKMLSETDRRILDIQRLMKEQKFQEAGQLFDSAKDERERTAELQFLAGVVAQGQGKYQDAVWNYERSMQFAQYKARSQQGLMLSLIALAQKQTPDVAQEVVSKLMKSHSDDPAVLMASAEIERMRDNLDGMKDRLATLKNVLDRQSADNPNGPYLIAASWEKAGRPDLARREIEAAVKTVGKKHIPSIMLAGRLAWADEDWDNLLIHAAELDEVQKDVLDSFLWKAAANIGQNKKDDARKVFETLKIKAPNLNSGYLGLAGMYEQAKEYDKALKVIREWREQVPQDAGALRIEVRLLTLMGKTEEAEKIGEESLVKQIKKLDEAYAENLKKNPPKDDKEKENLAKNLQESKISTELLGTLTIANGLQDGKKFANARAWYDRAIKVVEKRPADKRKEGIQAIQMLMADNYLQAGMNAKDDKATRDAMMGEALKLYQTLYKEAPDNLVLANNLAWMLSEEKKDPKAALEIVEKARMGRFSQKPITGDRLPVELLDTLGVIYRNLGNNEDAVKLFREASVRYSTEPRVFVHLGRAYVALNSKENRKEAFESLTKAIQLANSKMDKVQNPDQKAKLKDLVTEAQKDLQKVQ